MRDHERDRTSPLADSPREEPSLPASTAKYGQAAMPQTPEDLARRVYFPGNTVRERLLRSKNKSETRQFLLRVATILALRMAGYSNKQIAQKTGWSPGAIREVLYRARQDKLLDDVAADIYGELAPLAVEALRHHLRQRNLTAGLEVLKGTGYFRQYHEGPSKATGGVSVGPLVFQFVKADGRADEPQPSAVTVQPVVVGRPREGG